MVGKKISDCGRGAHFCARHFLPFRILDLRTGISSCIVVEQVVEDSVNSHGAGGHPEGWQKDGGQKDIRLWEGSPFCALIFLPFWILDLRTGT